MGYCLLGVVFSLLMILKEADLQHLTGTLKSSVQLFLSPR